MGEYEADGGPDERDAGARGRRLVSSLSSIGVGFVIFVLGLLAGFPLATTGAELLTQNLGQVISALFSLLMLALIVSALLFIFREPIWRRLFRRGEIEMERFARPLSDVARFAATQQVEQASAAARDLAELVLARYAWIATRRWMVATATAFIAAIAALAGTALLFQQNQLLRAQGELMGEQTQRLAEQNQMIEYQIELGEAQRSTAILPEIFAVAAQVNEAIEAVPPGPDGARPLSALSPGLRARIVAATNAARPYRYLSSPLLTLREDQIALVSFLRRDDLSLSAEAAEMLRVRGLDVDRFLTRGSGELIDRPLSPERGQLLALLHNAGLHDTVPLTVLGADFAHAEVRLPVLREISLRHAELGFSDFSGATLINVGFGGAVLFHARFVGSALIDSDLGAVSGTELHEAMRALGAPAEFFATGMSGADFRRATLLRTSFAHAQGYAVNFDGAFIHHVDFRNALIAGSTFREAVLGTALFEGADLQGVDFDGAMVFSADFLEAVAEAALPGTFSPERFALAPIDAAERDADPMIGQYLWLLTDMPGILLQAYRVERVLDFD